LSIWELETSKKIPRTASSSSMYVSIQHGIDISRGIRIRSQYVFG